MDNHGNPGGVGIGFLYKPGTDSLYFHLCVLVSHFATYYTMVYSLILFCLIKLKIIRWNNVKTDLFRTKSIFFSKCIASFPGLTGLTFAVWRKRRSLIDDVKISPFPRRFIPFFLGSFAIQDELFNTLPNMCFTLYVSCFILSSESLELWDRSWSDNTTHIFLLQPFTK